MSRIQKLGDRLGGVERGNWRWDAGPIPRLNGLVEWNV